MTMAQESVYAPNHNNAASPKVTSSGYSEMSSNHSGESAGRFPCINPQRFENC